MKNKQLVNIDVEEEEIQIVPPRKIISPTSRSKIPTYDEAV